MNASGCYEHHPITISKTVLIGEIATDLRKTTTRAGKWRWNFFAGAVANVATEK